MSRPCPPRSGMALLPTARYGWGAFRTSKAALLLWQVIFPLEKRRHSIDFHARESMSSEFGGSGSLALPKSSFQSRYPGRFARKIRSQNEVRDAIPAKFRADVINNLGICVLCWLFWHFRVLQYRFTITVCIGRAHLNQCVIETGLPEVDGGQRESKRVKRR